MSTCPDCTEAKVRAWWGGYRVSCTGCRTRYIARSLAAFNAWHPKGTGELEPLRELVGRLLPSMSRAEARTAVRGWYDIDHQPAEAKAPA